MLNYVERLIVLRKIMQIKMLDSSILFDCEWVTLMYLQMQVYERFYFIEMSFQTRE